MEALRLLFVDDEDDADPEEYARPGFTLYETGEDVELDGILPGIGDVYMLDR